MAEAHQAVAFNLAVTHEGVHINYDEEVLKLVFQSGLRSWKKRFARFINNFHNGIYPSSLEFLALIVVSVTALRLLFKFDTSFGFIDFINNLLVLPFIGPRLRILPIQLGCILIACLTYSIFLWFAKAMAMRYLLKMLLIYKGWMYEYRGASGVSFFTRAWVFLVKALTLKRPLLYSYQSSLPRLPLPPLNKTLERYLRSVKPLVSDEDYRRLEKEAKEFENGIGRKFQRYLLLKSWWSTNYVSDWWEEYVYLRGRSPIMVNSNFYAVDALAYPGTSKQSARAASIVYASLMFRRMIVKQELRPIMVQNLVPLCSWQYERLFNTTRIPGIETDKIVHLDDSQHIVVMCRDKFYRLDLYYKSKLLQPAQIQHQLEGILNDAAVEGNVEERYLGALTAGDRAPWCEARTKYFNKGINRVSLSCIENAAFILVLEDQEFNFSTDDDKHLSHVGKSLLHGKCYDRWFDKSFNLVVSTNGKVGFNAEHCWADAPIMAHYWEYVLSYEQKYLTYTSDGNCSFGSQNDVPGSLFYRLKWDLPRELKSIIENSYNVAHQLALDVDLKIITFNEYGKGFIKTCKVSPDAFIQFAFQLAYFRDNGKFCLTYEASMTRLFREGRTETVRPVTIESAAFVRAMCDENVSNSERIRLMRVASQRHQNGYQDAMCGKGIDRHLFCLYVISKYLEVDSPFLKEVLSEPWRLSTSQTPHGQAGMIDFKKNPESVCAGGGFGPVADDGYGVSYIIAGEDLVFFHISSKKSCPQTDSSRFAGRLKQALRDMKCMFEQKQNGA